MSEQIDLAEIVKAWSAPNLDKVMYQAALLKDQGIKTKIVLVPVGDGEWRAELRVLPSEK